MSAKFLQTFSEENSVLEKQIGCMNGIFQMFDRHNLAGGRRFKGQNNKKTPPGNSFVNAINRGTDNATCSPQLLLEKNLSENQRMSIESSRTSSSSSSCTSFSSIDCNKSTLQGSTSYNKSNFSDKSANKEDQSVSVKTSQKEEFQQSLISYLDSPRPIQLSSSMDGSNVIGGIDGKKSRSHLDQKESIRVLRKFKEAPWTIEAKEITLNRRFSYDGREMSTNLLDFRENCKPTRKLRELPRLSLDSKKSFMKSSNSIVKDIDRSKSNKEKYFTCSNDQKEFGIRKSAHSVVAKLMGLEAMPSLCSNHKEQVDIIQQRSSEKDLTEHCEKNQVVISKPSLTAKTRIELAPWKKQKEKHHVTQNTLKQQPETVYSEIERRLKDLEFHHANKDLRALKQILDAIQAKGLLESKKNEQNSPKLATTRSDENLGSLIAKKSSLPVPTKETTTRRAYDKPIVIMKPAKSLNRLNASTTSVVHVHDLSRIHMLRTSEKMNRKKETCSSKLTRYCSPRATPRINFKTGENGQKSRLGTELASCKPQQYPRENDEKSSNSADPRLQPKILEIERRIHSLVSSSDSRKHPNLLTRKKPSVSVSPRNKLGGRTTMIQQGDEMSPRSDSNMGLVTQVDMKYASAKKNFSSSREGHQKHPPAALDEEAFPSAIAAVAAEQPSPISVLDATFLHDDLSSAVVNTSTNLSEGSKHTNSDNLAESFMIDSEINQNKLGNKYCLTTDCIASLCEAQNPNHRYISEILLASGLLMKDLSSEPYSLMPIQLHPTGHPINPDLFLVLEQTKSSQVSKSKIINGSTLLFCSFDIEKLHRKLLFDVVNEVLVQKLEQKSLSSHPMILPARKLQCKLSSGQQLLEQLCSEIDQLHTETLMVEDPGDEDNNIIGEEILRQLPLEWNDYRRELPCIALDIERSIFKDMIDEVVSGEASSLKYKSRRRRRQLFAK